MAVLTEARPIERSTRPYLGARSRSHWEISVFSGSGGERENSPTKRSALTSFYPEPSLIARSAPGYTQHAIETHGTPRSCTLAGRSFPQAFPHYEDGTAMK